jgi:hypothetical protein
VKDLYHQGKQVAISSILFDQARLSLEKQIPSGKLLLFAQDFFEQDLEVTPSKWRKAKRYRTGQTNALPTLASVMAITLYPTGGRKGKLLPQKSTRQLFFGGNLRWNNEVTRQQLEF